MKRKYLVKVKETYVGTTYDVYLKDTRTKKGKLTSMTFIGKDIDNVKKQARKIYNPFMKIIRVKKITRQYKYN